MLWISRATIAIDLVYAAVAAPLIREAWHAYRGAVVGIDLHDGPVRRAELHAARVLFRRCTTRAAVLVVVFLAMAPIALRLHDSTRIGFFTLTIGIDALLVVGLLDVRHERRARAEIAALSDLDDAA